MTPQEWNVAIGPHVAPRAATAIIEAETRKYLSTLPAGTLINTPQLVEALYPAITARGAEIDNRARIMQVLLRRKDDGTPLILNECRVRDTTVVRKRYGRSYSPWMWGAPRPILMCPHCNRPMP